MRSNEDLEDRIWGSVAIFLAGLWCSIIFIKGVSLLSLKAGFFTLIFLLEGVRKLYRDELGRIGKKLYYVEIIIFVIGVIIWVFIW
jgi:hypothetical protein